jgi:hypothetical protein
MHALRDYPFGKVMLPNWQNYPSRDRISTLRRYFGGRWMVPMTEPTEDELMTRIAGLENQAAPKQTGKLEFGWARKAA